MTSPTDPKPFQKDEELECARAEMGEVREDNKRLKIDLKRITKDYLDLQTRFYDVVRREWKTPAETPALGGHCEDEDDREAELELFSLTLGPRSLSSSKKEKYKELSRDSAGLTLGLEYCNSDRMQDQSPDRHGKNSDAKEEPADDWGRRSFVETVRGTAVEQDELMRQNPDKRARVSVRARCDTPTMNDGCQWRKYGQKFAKGNPCPRAYYRCTLAPSCPVRKQVQRCVEDMSVLLTTYEGMHNHPLPISAAAMVSTTSAAASMLLSGSSTSALHTSSSSSSTTVPSIPNINFYHLGISKSKPMLFAHSPTLSTTPSHPIITLDLTSISNPFNKFQSTNPTYSSLAKLNFEAMDPWPANHRIFGHGNKSIYNPYIQHNQSFQTSPMHKNNATNNISHCQTHPQQSELPVNNIAATINAISGNASIHSALATTLSSIIGGKKYGSLGKNPKFGETFLGSNINGVDNGCATSYLNKPTSASSQSVAENLTILSSSLESYSTSKGTLSASPGEEKSNRG